MPMTLFILLNEKTCVTSLEQPHQSMQNFCLFCQKKNYSFYFIHPFLQNTHFSLLILHIYSIKYSLFYNYLLFPHSLPLSLTDPTLPNNQSTPTHHYHPPNHHHQGKPNTWRPIQSGQINPNTQNPIQSKGKPNQPHPIWNPLIKQQETKESDQWSERFQPEIGVIGDRQSMIVDILNGGEISVVVAINGR